MANHLRAALAAALALGGPGGAWAGVAASNPGAQAGRFLAGPWARLDQALRDPVGSIDLSLAPEPIQLESIPLTPANLAEAGTALASPASADLRLETDQAIAQAVLGRVLAGDGFGLSQGEAAPKRDLAAGPGPASAVEGAAGLSEGSRMFPAARAFGAVANAFRALGKKSVGELSAGDGQALRAALDGVFVNPAAAQGSVDGPRTVEWDYVKSGALRLTLGGLALEIRSYNDLPPEKRMVNRDVGYFIVDAAGPGFKGLRHEETVPLSRATPSRFQWPEGLDASVEISRKGDTITVKILGGQVQVGPVSATAPIKAPPVKQGRRRRWVAENGAAALVAIPMPGKVLNEDVVWVDPDRGIILVGDGLGGHAAGAIAARIAMRVIRNQLRARLTKRTTPAQAKVILKDAFAKANAAILRYSRRHPEVRNMGTTFSAGVVVRGVLVTANAGDSRTLVRRADGTLVAVTEDDSVPAVSRAAVLRILRESGADMARIRRTGVVKAQDITAASLEIRLLSLQKLDFLSAAGVKVLEDDGVLSIMAMWLRRLHPENIPRASRAIRRALRSGQTGLFDDPVAAQAWKARARDRGDVPLSLYETHPKRHAVTNSLGDKGFELGEWGLREFPLQPGDIVLAYTDGIGDNIPERRQRELAGDFDNPPDLVDIFSGEAERISLRPMGEEETGFSKPDDIAVGAMRYSPSRRRQPRRAE